MFEQGGRPQGKDRRLRAITEVLRFGKRLQYKIKGIKTKTKG